MDHKRRKLDIADEASGKETSLLLEKLRRMKMSDMAELNSYTEEEKMKTKMELILQHRSEFPTKLRPAIEEASGNPPEIFLAEVYDAVKNFFFGRYLQVGEKCIVDDEELPKPNAFQICGDSYDIFWAWLSEEWHGLDKDVDTEDEAEVAIRFFPEVLEEQLGRDIRLHYDDYNHFHLHLARPIHLSLTCAKAVSFVPLFLKLDAELDANELSRGAPCFDGLYAEVPYTNVTPDYLKYIMRHLLWDEITFHAFEKTPSPELAQESLLVLMRLKDEGFVKKEEIYKYSLAPWFLSRQPPCHKRQPLFEEKLNLLVDWDPSILRDDRIWLNCRIDHLNHESALRLFQILFQLGLSYWPMELGFWFHTYPGHSNFCRKFWMNDMKKKIGDELFATIVRDQLSSFLKENDHRLHDLVLAAANNDEIALDGLYTVFRFNPALALAGLRHAQSTDASDGK